MQAVFTPLKDAPPIREVCVIAQFEGDSAEAYIVGRGGVTKIEAGSKPGEYCDIPYIRVWKGEAPFAEFCQHRIIGVYFGEPADGVGAIVGRGKECDEAKSGYHTPRWEPELKKHLCVHCGAEIELTP